MEPQFSEKNTPTTRFTFAKNKITKNNWVITNDFEFWLFEKLSQFFDRAVNRLDIKHPESYLNTATIFYNQVDSENPRLIHYNPVLLFYTPWKHQKTFRFSDVFRR